MDKLLTRAQTPFTIAMLVAKRKSEGGANGEASSEKKQQRKQFLVYPRWISLQISPTTKMEGNRIESFPQ